MITEIENTFWFSESGVSHKTLPVGVYLLRFHQMKNEFYLSKSSDFNVPEKMYGDFSIVDRWLKTYEEKKARKKNLGILLSGIKGAGKTLTAELLCKKANQPVIMIRSGFAGENFETFLTNPQLGNCTIFIDEFEKTYNSNTSDGVRNAGEGLLQLLDGGYSTSHLFIFTVNDQDKMNDFLMNRPSRIYYRSDYTELPESVIREVGKDKNLSDDFITDLILCMKTLGNNASFDALMSIIDEAQRFGEKPSKAARYLNFKRSNMKCSLRVRAENLADGSIESEFSTINCTPNYDYDDDYEERINDTVTIRVPITITQSEEGFLKFNGYLEEGESLKDLDEDRVEELLDLVPKAKSRRQCNRYITLLFFSSKEEFRNFYFENRNKGEFEITLTKDDLKAANKRDSYAQAIINDLNLKEFKFTLEFDPYKDYGKAF